MLIDFFRTPRVAVLCSKRAPGIDYVLRHPDFRTMYEVACVVTTEESLPEHAVIESAGVPLIHHSPRAFDVRAEFDAITAGMLQELDVDVVVLLGYLYILTEPMLEAFEGRILNVHDSDLTLLSSDGRRRYPGLHATRDAILAGERETRSTLHVVTSEVDEGPIVARSEPFPVAPLVQDALALGALDMIRAYAYAHREWMMRRAWGPMIVSELEKLACGAVAV
jgi:folate-dependent phosphoribosylglycinamide formyltransferase PurN